MRFGDFFRAGHARGYFVYDVAGPNDRLFPPDVAPSQAKAYSLHRPSAFLRRDLWDAFVRDNEVPRAFDPARDVVVYGEQIREEFISITPIRTTEQIGWFRQFCERAPEPINEQVLHSLLLRPNWFVEVLRPGVLLSPALASAWKRERTALVRNVIQKWKQTNGLDVSIDAPLIPATPVPSETVEQIAAPVRHNDDGVRRAVLDALERMPTGELLRIPIPLCYFEQSVLDRICSSEPVRTH